MKKFVETTFGLVAGIGFLWAAIAIFVWDVGKLRQARDSRDGPGLRAQSLAQPSMTADERSGPTLSTPTPLRARRTHPARSPLISSISLAGRAGLRASLPVIRWGRTLLSTTIQTNLQLPSLSRQFTRTSSCRSCSVPSSSSEAL